jgi:hypothetical protein
MLKRNKKEDSPLDVYVVFETYDYFGEERTDVDCLFLSEEKAQIYITESKEYSESEYYIERLTAI